MNDTLISCVKRNFNINFVIVNNSNANVKIPDPLMVMCIDAGADLAYYIEEYNDTTLRFSKFDYILDEIAIRKIKFKILHPRNTISQTRPLSCLFFHNGNYRIRVKLNLSNFNKRLSDIYSNWVNFRVIEPYKIDY